ncbi:endo-1,4-beta-xylanase A precursor [Acetivibrio straminisolvens JCM 21531]|uniref:Endo-1,4-beta-xylanase A n=1 Tax=Acetivibrio straminisolvens JCM 21531 TaxID=1294263 RepID=W4VBH0_9FIRM|nr:endo-1,4-beta-xylanase A precursor [Acetivibrio straminisolvens JCM 21531]
MAILDVHPNVLIFVEGVEMYPKDGVWDDETFDTSPWTGTMTTTATGGAVI